VEFRATSREMTDTSRSIPAAIRLNAHPAFSPSAISTRSAAVNLRRVPATSNLPRPSPFTRALLGRYDTATLRNTSVALERQRQEGLAAIERARIEAENRRKAEEQARAEAARQAELARQETARLEAARQQAARIEAARQEAARLELARQEAARKAAAAASGSSGSSGASGSSGSSGSTSGSSSSSGSTSGSSSSSGSASGSNSGGSTTPAGSGGAATAVAFAKAQLGDPYVWAATGPNSWDCSGLTMKAWLAAGVRLPRVAQAQYNATTHVAIADLRPGDLVFYGTTSSSIYHVGMYVGNGMMIHAPRTGDVVKYSSIHYMRDLLPYGGRV
jgi:cell wall-associated NlpC family hydrolase